MLLCWSAAWWNVLSGYPNCEALIQYLLSDRQTRTPLGVGAPGGVASAGSKLISAVVAPEEISGVTAHPSDPHVALPGLAGAADGR